MIEVEAPTDERTMRSLRVRDRVAVSGTIVTGRDAAHRWLASERREEVARHLDGSFIFHCGPVVRGDVLERFRFVSAGPTTSMRMEECQAGIMRMYGLRGVIGKGGMGAGTLDALGTLGAAYMHAVGGAGALMADSVVLVRDVFMLHEFGVPEALWVIEVRGLPAVVTMDSWGGSLHEEVEQTSTDRLAAAREDGPFRIY